MSKQNLVIFASLASTALVVVLLVMPAFDYMNVDRQILTDKQATLEQVNQFNQKIAELNNQYQSNEVESLLSALPKKEELSALLIQLEGLATDNGLIMRSVNFAKIENSSQAQAPMPDFETQGTVPNAVPGSQESQVQPYNVLSVALELGGGYEDFKNYLRAVEKNTRLMDVVSMSAASGSFLAQSSSFSVGLRVYYQ